MSYLELAPARRPRRGRRYPRMERANETARDLLVAEIERRAVPLYVVAEALGVHETALRRWLTGETYIPLASLLVLAESPGGYRLADSLLEGIRDRVDAARASRLAKAGAKGSAGAAHSA